MPASPEIKNLTTARRFLVAVESMDGSILDDVFSPDIKQVELPNLFKPGGETRDLAALKSDIQKAVGIIDDQRYEVLNEMAAGDQVVFEMVWTGTMAVDAPPLKKGQQLRAQCVAVFDFEDGRVMGLRNYDCFDPY